MFGLKNVVSFMYTNKLKYFIEDEVIPYTFIGIRPWLSLFLFFKFPALYKYVLYLAKGKPKHYYDQCNITLIFNRG